MALTTAKSATPLSAKTASQSVAMPISPSTITTTFTPMAKAMFCQTMVRVFRARRKACANREGWSVCNTTSAVSIAMSAPAPPIAMPTLLKANTGASLMPSPTKATFRPCFCKVSMRSALCCGSKSPRACSSFSSSATLSTNACLSPDSISTCVIPTFRSIEMASAASGFSVSESKIQPMKRPFLAQATMVSGMVCSSSG